MILRIRMAALAGQAITAFRAATGVRTQTELVNRSGVALQQVNKYERGIVVPSLGPMIRILHSSRWALVAMPEEIADTHDEREAVIAAARRWERDAGGAGHGDLIAALNALDEAESAVPDVPRRAAVPTERDEEIAALHAELLKLHEVIRAVKRAVL